MWGEKMISLVLMRRQKKTARASARKGEAAGMFGFWLVSNEVVGEKAGRRNAPRKNLPTCDGFF